ncbi:MAG: DUF4157 domain-containing protein [Steroidobacteraceae bacterium]|nr:DUF4157 domain-containing protein [Steroidobacteraceae bacterium]
MPKQAVVERRPVAASRTRSSVADARPIPVVRSLQQRLGNRGTQALAARVVARSSAPGPASASGAATGQLSLSHPGDAHEREAESVADKVMRMADPVPGLSGNSYVSTPVSASSVHRRCAECEETKAHTVARDAKGEASAATGEITPSVSADIRALQGKGSPLPAPARAFFEPRFGANFSDVRVHTDTGAARTSNAINAKAFTVGTNIAFGAGQFSPDSQQGRHLLAHELTHVVQQGGAGPARTVQRDPDPQAPADPKKAPDPAEPYPHQDEIRDRLAEIDSRLAVLTKEYADAYSKQDVSMPQLIALKKRYSAVNRERFIVDTIKTNSASHMMTEQEVDGFLAQAGSAATTEQGSLALLSKMLLGNSSGLDVVQYLLLKQPELFPDHVIGLYKDAVRDLQERSVQNDKSFKAQVAAITSKPTDWLVKVFLYMMKHELELQELASRVNFHVALDPEEPVLLERQGSNATGFAIEDLKGRIQDAAHKAHPPEVEEGLGFLYPALEAAYFADFYGGVAEQMHLFTIAVESSYERLNIASDPDVGADVLRAYSSGIRFAVGPGYVDFHSNVATAAGGYTHAHEAIEQRLDQWVAGLSDLGKISEGFGMYDVWEDAKTALKSLFTLAALKNLLIFFGVMVAIQFIPFGNLIADLIIYGLFGAAMVKMIFIFGSYFSAAASATNFRQLLRASQLLEEAGPAVVDVAVQLATFGIGKAIGRFIKSRGRKFKSAEDLKNDPIVKEMKAEDQAQFNKLLGENTGYRAWKERLGAKTRQMLERNPELEKIFAEMDSAVRDLLTLCESPCIPETATAAQAARIKTLLGKLQVAEGSEAFQYLREYLHSPKNRANLEPVIKELEGLNSKVELQARIEKAIHESAAAKGLTAVRRPDGKWEVTVEGSGKVTEYSVQPHNKAPGTKRFFNSHHGIQGAWGRARVKGYIYEQAPTILLRNSRMNTPHQIVSALQKAREAGVGSRTYAQERALLHNDMKAAGVPAADANAILAASDAFFAKLYSKQPPSMLESIFGDWKP